MNVGVRDSGIEPRPYAVGGVRAAIGGALVMALVSTLGDYVWAAWIPRHRAFYGLAHGTLLFLCLGLYLGALRGKPAFGAIAGALIGGLAAGSFYLLAPLTGFSIMFVSWIAIWIAFGTLYGRLSQERLATGSVLARGAIAAIASGLAFYLISDIWFPFNPRGLDYLVHFGAWTLAFLPGLAALLVARRSA